MVESKRPLYAVLKEKFASHGITCSALLSVRSVQGTRSQIQDFFQTGSDVLNKLTVYLFKIVVTLKC